MQNKDSLTVEKNPDGSFTVEWDKKDPNWISMSDGLGYNFNMNNYG